MAADEFPDYASFKRLVARGQRGVVRISFEETTGKAQQVTRSHPLGTAGSSGIQ
jgi:hypothetical protein